MIKKFWISTLLISLALFTGSITISAQEATSTPSDESEKKQEEKADRERKAFILLEQIVNESQLLRLPENRINIQIDTADLLWDSNQARARTLFAGAADGIAEMMRNIDPNEERRGPNPSRTAGQLRQKLVLTAARHEAALAYQFLAATLPPPSSADNRTSRGAREDDLEHTLLARIAALDPKMALQNAEELLDKGQFPRNLTSVLTQLQRKDKEAAAKLEDKLIKRLQSANLLMVQDAGRLALGLLRDGPRTSGEASSEAPAVTNEGASQVLGQTAYVELLGTVIDAGLRSIPPPPNQRAPNNPRGRRNLGPGGIGQNTAQGAPTQAQIEQANARTLMNGLRNLLPQIDRYLPVRSAAVRDKISELGMTDTRATNQLPNLMRQGTADDLLAAARIAPEQMQSRIYQRAATRALEEGNADRARQIATDYLEGSARDRMLQQVDFRQISERVDATKLDELRATLSGLRSDSERVDLLIKLSFTSRQSNPKLALQLLEQAKQLTHRRAVNYQQFEQQLKVAEAFRELEPARSFEVLEPGIAQLNELLSAAATLSGFEVNVFRDGELPLESRNNLSGMVTRYGQALGVLARTDFDRAQALADRFQLTEPRILARVSIVKGLLGVDSSSGSRSIAIRQE